MLVDVSYLIWVHTELSEVGVVRPSDGQEYLRDLIQFSQGVEIDGKRGRPSS